MKTVLISLTMISSLLMVGVILLQQGKGADLGSAFGSGARGGLFGSTGRANFLTRTTSALMTVFLLASLALSVYLGQENRDDGILRDLQSGAESIPATEIDTANTVLEALEAGEAAEYPIEDSAAPETGEELPGEPPPE